MAQFHFVEDYERYVAGLMRKHPIDTAMSLAVGGDYARIGGIECEILRHAGLRAGQDVVDLGCGSGRLAVALAAEIEVGYVGLDVVPALLDYARSKCPRHYRFVLNQALTLPLADASQDVVAAFSVFTHLLHAETYLYLEEMRRCLRPGGQVVFSFLEFAADTHWAVFEATVAEQRRGPTAHLNQFIERDVIVRWAHRLGYRAPAFIDGWAAPWPSGQLLGQSIAVLAKG